MEIDAAERDADGSGVLRYAATAVPLAMVSTTGERLVLRLAVL